MTEMFISAFYAVVDPINCEIRFANTGHPHAFLLPDNGDFERLVASSPPLGMDERAPETDRRTWNPKRDMLVLFTDGVSDARSPDGSRLGEEPVLSIIRENRNSAPKEILDRIMALLDAHTDGEPRRDDLTLVLVRA